MQRRSFMQTIQGIIGGRAAPLDNVLAKAKQRTTLQHSAIAGFQYQQGEKFWPQIKADDPLQLIREPDNPYDKRAIRIKIWLEV